MKLNKILPLIILLLFSTLLFSSNIPSLEYHSSDNINSYLKKEKEMHGRGSAEQDWFSHLSNFLNITTTSSSNLEKKYSSKKSIDKIYSTAWVEGKKDEGINEWIQVKIGLKGKYRKKRTVYFRLISLFSGLGDKKYFFKNNRIKIMHCIIKNGNSEKKYLINLKDKFEIQHFFIPWKNKIELNSKNPNVTIKFLIKEVYKGTKWNDTCLSDISFSGMYWDRE